MSRISPDFVPQLLAGMVVNQSGGWRMFVRLQNATG